MKNRDLLSGFGTAVAFSSLRTKSMCAFPCKRAWIIVNNDQKSRCALTSKNQHIEISSIYEIIPKVGHFFDDRVARDSNEIVITPTTGQNRPRSGNKKANSNEQVRP